MTGATHNSTESVGLIIVGNSGVGKSFLANILIGAEKFKHEFQPDAVTTATEYFTAIINNKLEVTVFNIPGLIENDQNAIERNKLEIEKAFKIQPNSIIVYVFGNSGGRIRDEDVVAFQALDKAYRIERESLCFVVNDLPERRPPKYEGETVSRIQELLTIKNIRVTFLDRIIEGDDGSKQAIFSKLAAMIEKCKPRVHQKHQEIVLQKDDIARLKKEIREKQTEYNNNVQKYTEQITKLQADYEALKNRPPEIREIHHHHDSGGCNVM